MKKRILMAARWMVCGGVEKTMLNLLNTIDYDLYEVELHLLYPRGEFLNRIPEQVTVRPIRFCRPFRPEFLDIWGKPWRRAVGELLREKDVPGAVTYLYCKTLAKLFGEEAVLRPADRHCILPENFDVVCDYYGFQGFTTMYAAWAKGNPVKCLWVHTDNQSSNDPVIKRALKQFDHIYAVSTECANQFLGEFPFLSAEKVSVIRNVVSREEILQKAEMVPPVRYDELTVVSAGRLTEQKNYQLAVHAAGILRDRGLLCRMVILGDGPQREALQRLIAERNLQDRVILHGFAENPYPYMKQADIYLQTSLYEGFVTTVTEAMALGKPIVSTAVSGIREQVEHGVNGHIVPAEAEAVADALQELMESREKRQRFGQNSLMRKPGENTLWEDLCGQWFGGK